MKGLDSFAKNFGTPGYESDEELHSQLGKVITDFKLQNLQDKVGFLGLLKEKTDFTTILSSFRKSSRWRVYSLITDEGFKRGYIYTALDEEEKSFNESFKKSMNDYIKLAEEGKNVAGKCFEKGIDFQAYCEEAGNDDKTLNVNLVDYNGGEPIKISDILQQEGNIGELNIYCNRKHDICARREDKKRYYEFKEGACYQMTSTWPIKDKSGKVVLTCIMVMNVGSDGITEILEFSGEEPDGKNYQFSSEKNKGLIKKNEELYIQGLPLCEAVGKFLKLRRGKEAECGENIVSIGGSNEHIGVIPTTAHNSSQDTEANRGSDEKLGGQVLKNSGDNSPTTSTANKDLSVHTGASSCDAAVQTETTMKQVENLESENRRLKKENTEYNQFIEAGLQGANEEKKVLIDELKNLSVEKKKSDQSLVEAEQRIKKLAVHNEQKSLGLVVNRLRRKQLSEQKEIKYQQKWIKEMKEECFNRDSIVKEIRELNKRKNTLASLDGAIKCLEGLEGIRDDSDYSSDEESDNTRSNFPVFPTIKRSTSRPVGS